MEEHTRPPFAEILGAHCALGSGLRKLWNGRKYPTDPAKTTEGLCVREGPAISCQGLDNRDLQLCSPRSDLGFQQLSSLMWQHEAA